MCTFIIGLDANEQEITCPRPAIANCAEPNCGDEICAGHGEQCENCGQWFCFGPHMQLHKCEPKAEKAVA